VGLLAGKQTTKNKRYEPRTNEPRTKNQEPKTGLMEVETPKPKTGKRRYVRNRPFEQTPARVAAYTANFKKAVAAPKEKRYGRSEKRTAANRKSLEKGREVLRQRFESLFPGYPPQEAGVRDSGLGNPNWATLAVTPSRNPESRIPNPEPPTPIREGSEQSRNVA